MKRTLQETAQLIRKEWLLEARQKSTISGIFLYLASTVFVCFLSFERLNDTSTWNALLWIIILFVSTNAATKSFQQESGSKRLYLYTLVHPKSIILSKLLYNSVLISMLSFLSYGIYSLLLGNPTTNSLVFFIALGLGGIGLSTILTMNTAIASNANQSSALITILSFPLMMPLLITLIKLSRLSIMGDSLNNCTSLLFILVFLNVLIAALSYLLFPYLWRE
jgi:heme exporter protein B